MTTTSLRASRASSIDAARELRMRVRVLDAAARLVEQRGIERLSAADVADAADLALDAVRGQFPDRISVLSELGRRSRDRLTTRLADAFRPRRTSLDDSIRTFVETLATHYRDEAAVRSIGLGDRIDLGDDRHMCSWADVAAPVSEALQRDHRLQLPIAVAAVESAGPLADALVELAFRHHAGGERAYLKQAHVLARTTVRSIVL